MCLNSVHLYFDFVIHLCGTKFKKVHKAYLSYEVYNWFLNLPIMNGEKMNKQFAKEGIMADIFMKLACRLGLNR